MCYNLEQIPVVCEQFLSVCDGEGGVERDRLVEVHHCLVYIVDQKMHLAPTHTGLISSMGGTDIK